MIDIAKKEVSAPIEALLALAGINIIWGAMFPLTKPALDIIPPFTFAFLRFCVAMIVILPLSGREALTCLRGPDRMRLVFMGFLGFCVAQVAQTLALKLSTASDIALLATTSPLWIALLARLYLGERLIRLSGVGFLVAIVGIVIVIWPKKNGDIGLSNRVLGDAIFMVTGFTWACYNVLGKTMMQRYQSLQVTASSGIIGTLCIVPFAVIEFLNGQSPQFTLISVGGVIYAGLLVTALGFTGLFWALGRVRAGHAAIMMYLQPLAGVTISWLILHEQVGLEFIIGAGLVLGGVYLVTGKVPGKVKLKTHKTCLNA